ncbi:MAG: hypothetical protein MUC93_12740 [Bacteroidales bacterium]|jgi:hypothetical protein|nr:hypothetical protein [Bacteroidales bacterium]
MINYLKHNEIDREQWDNCIKDSRVAKPYAFSWYLDIMSPGWEALIDDDYDSVFPIPGLRKYGIQYISTPIFLQQLGAYTPDKSQVKALNEFLDFIPEFYRLIDLCVGQRIDNDRYKVTLKANYELDLSKPYDKLRDGFSNHCKRNIEKSAKKRPELADDVTPGELIELFISNKGTNIKGIKARDYQRLNDLMNFCLKNKKGRIIGVRASKKRLIYGMFLVEIKGNKTMLFVVNSPASRERRTGYYFVNELIKESAGTKTILDFAGSSLPSVASFMESFGSRNVPFYRIYRNRLPWPIRMLK